MLKKFVTEYLARKAPNSVFAASTENFVVLIYRGVSVSMTPEAAESLAEMLKQCAALTRTFYRPEPQGPGVES